MKRRLRKRRFLLMRPTDALLPMAFLAGEMFGPAILRGWIFAGWFGVQLFSLFSADSVRMAFATQPGMRKVKGSTTLAMIMQIIGAGIAAGMYTLVFHGITPFTLTIIGIGLLLNIEHVFYEYLNAIGDRYSATICSILVAVFLLTGIMLEPGGVPFITLSLTGAACLISVMVAVISGGFRPCKLNTGVLVHALRAIIYGIAYPLIVTVAIFGTKRIFGAFFEEVNGIEKICLEAGARIGFFTGFALTALYRTPFRRSSLECREMKPILGSMCALCFVVCVASGLIEAIPSYVSYAASAFSFCIVFAVVIIFALWANFKKAE